MITDAAKIQYKTGVFTANVLLVFIYLYTRMLHATKPTITETAYDPVLCEYVTPTTYVEKINITVVIFWP